MVARVLAVVTAFEDGVGRRGGGPVSWGDVVGALAHDEGRFDPAVLLALRAALDKHGLATVVLSGGAFQNRLLLESTARRLEEAGLRVLLPRRLPPNDGGIAFGQAAVAARA